MAEKIFFEQSIDLELQKYEAELGLLQDNLHEEREQASKLNLLIENEDKKIAELNEKTESLLQEQKYEIIEIVQLISKNFSENKDKISLNKEDFDKMAGQLDQKDNEIADLKKEKDDLAHAKDCEIEELRKQIQHYKNIMNSQNQFIGQYRGSVVFPFFRITNTIGKTRLGNMIEKIIK